jgi:cytochrome bd-type quinol oxidase subunit 2
MKMSPDTDNPQRDRATFAAAAKFACVFVAIAVLVLLAAMAWLSGCKTGTGEGALDTCSTLQRNTLAVGPAVVLFVGGVWAFLRTYQTWRARGGWWIWQGAGWFLLVLMLVVLTMTVPPALLS